MSFQYNFGSKVHYGWIVPARSLIENMKWRLMRLTKRIMLSHISSFCDPTIRCFKTPIREGN